MRPFLVEAIVGVWAGRAAAFGAFHNRSPRQDAQRVDGEAIGHGSCVGRSRCATPEGARHARRRRTLAAYAQPSAYAIGLEGANGLGLATLVPGLAATIALAGASHGALLDYAFAVVRAQLLLRGTSSHAAHADPAARCGRLRSSSTADLGPRRTTAYGARGSIAACAGAAQFAEVSSALRRRV